MEKYKILLAIIASKKRLTQKEIEENEFEQFNDTIIYETNNKTEAEEIIKKFVNNKDNKKYCYNEFLKNYTYVRFELVQEICVDDTPNHIKYKSLGIYFPKYEEDEEDE